MAYTGAASTSYRKIIAAMIITALTVTSITVGSIYISYSSALGLVFNGSIYVNGSGIFVGNVTAENVFLPAYIATHTNVTMAVATAGVWENVTFDTHAASEKARITHNHSSLTNDTFTVVDTGLYGLSYGISFIDTEAAPNNHIAIRVINNGTEINGSVFEKDTTKQNAVGTLYRVCERSLIAGDELKLQFVSNATTVSMQTEGTYGVHPTSGNMNLYRIA